MAIGQEQRVAPPGSGPEEPLLSNGSSLFEYRNRPRRDVPWLVAYLLILATALAGGVFSFLHRNTRYLDLIGPDAVADPKLCPISATTHASRRLLQQGPDAPSAFDLDLFMRAAGAWLAASAGGALLVGLLFVWLVRTTPRGLVAVALGLQVTVPAAMGGLAAAKGLVGPAVTLLVLAGLMLLLFALWRPQIELVTSLLGLAGRGLSANAGLVPLALGLQVVLLGLLELPLLVAAIAAFMNGTLVFNTDRADGGEATRAEECVGPDGQQVACCEWQTEPWVPAYLTLAGITMTWSVFLAFQIKLFTVAGAVAQWYFAPRSGLLAAGTSATAGGGGGGGSRNRTLTALRFAAGPSLGSLCCGSAVLTAVSMIRQAMEKARQERDRNLIAACAAACLSLLLSLVEFVTRFATVRAAISGEAFFTAGRNVVGLLKRNAMDAFGVWWLPPMILQSCCFILALSWATAVALISYATTWRHQAESADPKQASTSAFLTALVALLAAWTVLGFLASLISNIIDSLFVCFAMDRDVGQVSWMEAHLVLVKLPTVQGAVVQQPDGGLVYGAPPGQQYPPIRGGGGGGSEAQRV